MVHMEIVRGPSGSYLVQLRCFEHYSVQSLKGLRFDNTAEKCVDMSKFDCSHHCSTEDCDFNENTITYKKAGGGELIPGLHLG